MTTNMSALNRLSGPGLCKAELWPGTSPGRPTTTMATAYAANKVNEALMAGKDNPPPVVAANDTMWIITGLAMQPNCKVCRAPTSHFYQLPARPRAVAGRKTEVSGSSLWAIRFSVTIRLVSHGGATDFGIGLCATCGPAEPLEKATRRWFLFSNRSVRAIGARRSLTR